MKNSFESNNLSKNKSQKAPRAPFHDYCAPGYYLITITAHNNTPRLSEITCPRESLMQKGKMIIPTNTPLGECVERDCQACN